MLVSAVRVNSVGLYIHIIKNRIQENVVSKQSLGKTRESGKTSTRIAGNL